MIDINDSMKSQVRKKMRSLRDHRSLFTLPKHINSNIKLTILINKSIKSNSSDTCPYNARTYLHISATYAQLPVYAIMHALTWFHPTVFSGLLLDVI